MTQSFTAEVESGCSRGALAVLYGMRLYLHEDFRKIDVETDKAVSKVLDVIYVRD